MKRVEEETTNSEAVRLDKWRDDDQKKQPNEPEES